MSHETIYLSLFVQSKALLRKELTAQLRTKRVMRKAAATTRRGQGRGQIVDAIPISDRPAEVEDRAVPGHWEGDLITGKLNKSAVGALVERSTGYVLLLHLPINHGTQAVTEALLARMAELPAQLRRSVTWDQGKEMAAHAELTSGALGEDFAVYFCDPHSPWQRPVNENTNGLLRQYLPKGTDLSVHSAADLAWIEQELNDRPRKRLDYARPSEAINDLLLR